MSAEWGGIFKHLENGYLMYSESAIFKLTSENKNIKEELILENIQNCEDANKSKSRNMFDFKHVKDLIAITSK